MRLTKVQLESMLPGQVLIAKCIDAAEWESAKRIAQRVKKEFRREDGERYIVTQDVVAQTVRVETTNGPYADVARRKKLVYGTQRGLDRQIALYKAKGWIVDRTEAIPRGSTGRLTYIAHLKREGLCSAT